MDARQFLRSESAFLKKQELRDEGPRRLVIAGTESRPARFGKSGESELFLRFTDGTLASLRADTVLRAVIRWFGPEADGWVGQEVEAYFDPNVQNPRGGEPGGIRFRRPDSATTFDYRSDLEDVPASSSVS